MKLFVVAIALFCWIGTIDASGCAPGADGLQCFACPANCICSASGGCDDCKEGYFLTNGACEQTDVANCAVPTSKTVCEECEDGFFVDGSDCTETEVDDCKVPFNETVCEECDDGYFLSGADCVETDVDHCKTPYNETFCEECEDGHFWDGEDCTATTVEHCKTPENDTYCNECEDGYFGSGSTCTETDDDHCMTPFNATDCDVCEPGYYRLQCNESDFALCYTCEFEAKLKKLEEYTCNKTTYCTSRTEICSVIVTGDKAKGQCTEEDVCPSKDLAQAIKLKKAPCKTTDSVELCGVCYEDKDALLAAMNSAGGISVGFLLLSTCLLLVAKMI